MADITEIGTVGEFDLGDEEESEEAFAEINEYVRMGILLVNEELQPLKQSSLIHWFFATDTHGKNTETDMLKEEDLT